jgi:hypothetical protein
MEEVLIMEDIMVEDMEMDPLDLVDSLLED